MDEEYIAKDPIVNELSRKGSNYSEKDKSDLRDKQLELLGAVLPEYRLAAEHGQIEISTTPYYHPILPLLCDTDIARVSNPHSISPDLTRNDKSKQGPTGGPITKDNTSIEYYDTIFTIAESPVKKGVISTGSDDGLVQVTQDGGAHWTNVTPKNMPEWIQINSVEASPFDAGTAYFAGTMYKSDDFRPYLYKTTDYGKTWTQINNGITAPAFTRVIRKIPNHRDLLVAGTENPAGHSRVGC